MLVGEAVILAKATQNLSSFNLDLRGFLAVESVEVGTKKGHELKPADWSRDGQELTVSPRPKIRDGRLFSVVIEYAGVVEPVVDPDESVEGFIPTSDGAELALARAQRRADRPALLRLGVRPLGHELVLADAARGAAGARVPLLVPGLRPRGHDDPRAQGEDGRHGLLPVPPRLDRGQRVRQREHGDFIAAAEEAYRQDLDAFFDVWLFQPGKPTSW